VLLCITVTVSKTSWTQMLDYCLGDTVPPNTSKSGCGRDSSKMKVFLKLFFYWELEPKVYTQYNSNVTDWISQKFLARVRRPGVVDKNVKFEKHIIDLHPKEIFWNFKTSKLEISISNLLIFKRCCGTRRHNLHNLTSKLDSIQKIYCKKS